MSFLKNILADLLKALLGNGSVNTFQHTGQAKEEVFSMWSAPRSSGRAVFSAWSVPRLSNGILFVALMSTKSRTTDTGNRIGELGRVLESRLSKVIEE
jgi:hypothetical protein